jgi:SagB-type dehydrogenase family enzyme
MFTKEIYKYLEYHISSRNVKALFTGKTDHLRHYDNHIVELQRNVGLNNYESENKIRVLDPISLNIDFADVMNKRKSERKYLNYKISLKEISTLLYYSCGYKKNDPLRKNVPSSGGFNTTEIFAIVLSSNEIAEGIYYFDTKANTLNTITLGNFREWIKNDAFFQEEWSEASIIFVLAANITRLSQKYLSRAYRLCLLDVGHVAQNLYLTCAAMDLRVCEVLGYLENEIEEALGIDGINIASFSTIVIGK